MGLLGVEPKFFGRAAIPIGIVIFALQAWIYLYPPPTVGSVFVPSVVGLVAGCQNVINLLTGEELTTARSDKISMWTVVPVSMFLVLTTYAGKVLIAGFATANKYTKTYADGLKFGECFIRGTYYLLMFLCVRFIVISEDYWPNTRNCHVGSLTNQVRSIELQSYYVLELSYYSAGIFIHVFIDQPLKDFWVMLSHHVLTVCLVACSYFFNLQRFGLLVLMVHDVSDVFLDYGKCFHYLDMEFYSTVTFINLIISWAVYRLYIYPVYLINSAMFETHQVIVVEEGHDAVPMYWFFQVWLVTLQVLHFYWFFLILKVAYIRLIDGELEDVRDDSAKIKATKKAE